MMKTHLIGINLFLLICSSIFIETISEIDEWKMVKETEFWTVYTRNSETSSVKEVKVEGIMHANFESVKLAMCDITAYPKWVYSCLESYKFDELNDNEFHSYTKTNLPFPLKDRDLIVFTELNTHKSGEWHSISNSKPSHLPEIKSAVRIKKYHAEWKMKAKSDKTIDFEYQLAMEPGGFLPAWVINLAIAKVPLNTISALEERSIEIMNMQ